MQIAARADSKFVPFGSVWWILDAILALNWKRQSCFQGRPFGRHPVLIIAQNYRFGAAERIPTLFGGSKKWNAAAFCVYGLTPDRTRRDPTYFFDALLPLAPPIFTSNDPVSGKPIASRNVFRPILNPNEEQRLRDWLRLRVKGRRGNWND